MPAIKSPKVQKTEKVEEIKAQVATPVKQTVSKAKGVPKKNGKKQIAAYFKIWIYFNSNLIL